MEEMVRISEFDSMTDTTLHTCLTYHITPLFYILHALAS
jgi:hypothetical protein